MVHTAFQSGVSWGLLVGTGLSQALSSSWCFCSLHWPLCAHIGLCQRAGATLSGTSLVSLLILYSWAYYLALICLVGIRTHIAQLL